MKTIKIIDLLNKIANNDKLPNKIKWRQAIYDLVIDADFINYKPQEDGDWLLNQFLWKLNDEVEIIEEDKKIEKIKNNCYYNPRLSYEEVRRHLVHNFKVITSTVNELIDEVNKLKEVK